MRVFFDIDTQIDFLFPAGALYAPGAEKIVERIGALNRWAASKGIALISTVDAHSEDDPEFRLWPHHCVAGTVGQTKPCATLLDQRMVVPNVKGDYDIGQAKQIILEKQTTDCFTNVNIDTLLASLGTDECYVYGVVTEVCVKNATLGLLQRRKPVTIVTDAVECFDASAARAAYAEFQSKGVKLTTSSELLAS